MAKTKKEGKLKLSPKEEEIKHARYMFDNYSKNRASAPSVQKLKECDFWIAHWRTVLKNLENN